MKIKPSKQSGRVTLEVEPGESRLLTPEIAAGSSAFRLKKILAPIDFSECSRKALQYARAFCDQFQAALILLYVIEIPYGNPEIPMIELDQWQTQMREHGQAKLAELLRGEGLGSTMAEPVLRIGNPYREIVQTARDKAVDLIIISTHGHTGFSRLFMGSTAERVVRHAGCPVLVVRENEHEFVQSAGTAASIRKTPAHSGPKRS